MKILYLSSLCSVKEYQNMFQKSGTTSSHAAQKFNRLIVNGLIENGAEVECLTKRTFYNIQESVLDWETEIENTINYTYLPFYKKNLKNRLLAIKNTYKFLRRWAKKYPDGVLICDILSGELSIAVLLASRINKIKRIALVMDVPCIRAENKRKGIKKFLAWVKNSLIYSYSGYIFLTHQMNDVLNKKNRPYAIVEGIADDSSGCGETTVSFSEKGKTIMMAGLLDPIFGVDLLLDAFQMIEDEQARLKLYGKGSSVERIVELSKIDERIQYGGELLNNEIIEEEKKALLLINPRTPAGEWTAYSFPSKNMEYMASGTPLVAFDLPCIPNEYKEYFYQLKEPTASSVCAVLEELLKKDAQELADFGDRASKWIKTSKSPKIQTKKIIELIETLRI